MDRWAIIYHIFYGPVSHYLSYIIWTGEPLYIIYDMDQWAIICYILYGPVSYYTLYIIYYMVRWGIIYFLLYGPVSHYISYIIWTGEPLWSFHPWMIGQNYTLLEQKGVTSSIIDEIIKLRKTYIWSNDQLFLIKSSILTKKLIFWPKYQFWPECQYLHLPHHLPAPALSMCFFLYQKEIYALKKVKPQNFTWAEWAVPFKSLHIINPLIMST